MSSITANDVKTRGVAAIRSALAHQSDAVISVRGKSRFVVMDVAQYRYLRECELDGALAQSQADVAAGRYVVEMSQAHMARLEFLLAAQVDGATSGRTGSSEKNAIAKTAGGRKPPQ